MTIPKWGKYALAVIAIVILINLASYVMARRAMAADVESSGGVTGG